MGAQKSKKKKAGGETPAYLQREHRRAQKLHALFLEFKPMMQARPLLQVHQQMKKRWRGGGFSLKRFYVLLDAWRKSPGPGVFVRRWKPSINETPQEVIDAVAAFAVARRESLQSAHRTLGLPVSYSTLFRRVKCRNEIHSLLEIKRMRERLDRREKILLAKISGGSRP